MNPETLRADIPALEETTYLNWGASGPSPRRVVRAVTEALETHEYRDPAGEGMYPAADQRLQTAREAVGGLLGAESGDVALTDSTTDGINRVATALDWEPGDVIVTTSLEHSAGLLPWRRLERRVGTETRVVEAHDGVFDLADVEAAVEDASLLCVSALDWKYGRMHPVAELVDLAHEHGTRVLVDAVQVPGQRPIDVTEWGADFVVGAGHKWLLGPWGAGFLYVDPELSPTLEPAHVGYRSVEEPNDDPYELKDGAARFEVATMSPAVYAGLVEGIESVQSVGLDTVESRIESLTDRFKERVPGERLLSPEAYHSGLVTLQVEEPESVVESLAAEDLRIRALPMPGTVRFSFHAVNTTEDVDAAVTALRDALV